MGITTLQLKRGNLERTKRRESVTRKRRVELMMMVRASSNRLAVEGMRSHLILHH
jgi:hypothetical protein